MMLSKVATAVVTAIFAVLVLPEGAAADGTTKSCGLLVGFGSSGAIASLDLTPGAVKTTILGIPVPGADGTPGLAVDTDGRVFAVNIFVESNQAQLFEMDPVTGKLVKLVGTLKHQGGGPVFLSDLSFQPGTNVLYGVVADGVDLSFGDLVTIDTITAEVRKVGSPAWPSSRRYNPQGIAFADDGTLYGFQRSGIEYYTLDPTNGELLTTNPINIGQVSGGLKFEAFDGIGWIPDDGGLLVLSGGPGFGGHIFTLDPVSGTTSFVGTANDDPNALIIGFAYTGVPCQPSQPDSDESSETNDQQEPSDNSLCQPTPGDPCFFANLVLMHTTVLGNCIIQCALPGRTKEFQRALWTCGGCPEE